MADEDKNEQVQDEIPPEIIAEAGSHGWVGKDEFKGDKSKWVDAKTFLEGGQTFIPFLKAESGRLRQGLEAERQARLKLEGELEASRKSIETLSKLNEEDRAAAVESAKKEVKAQIAEAIKSGDTEVLGELTEQLIKLTTPLPAPEEDDDEPAPVKPNGEVRQHPDFQPWVAKNKWFGTDSYKSNLAMAEAQRLRESGDTSQGMAFFDKVAAGVDKLLNPRATRSKVESGDLGGGGGTGEGSSFHDLPSEAKAECNREAKSRVGPNKPYKTLADWQNRYATVYFNQPGVTRQ